MKIWKTQQGYQLGRCRHCCTIFPCYLGTEIIGAKDIAMFPKKKQWKFDFTFSEICLLPYLFRAYMAGVIKLGLVVNNSLWVTMGRSCPTTATPGGQWTPFQACKINSTRWIQVHQHEKAQNWQILSVMLDTWCPSGHGWPFHAKFITHIPFFNHPVVLCQYLK